MSFTLKCLKDYEVETGIKETVVKVFKDLF